MFGLTAQELIVGAAAFLVLLIIALLIWFIASRNAKKKKKKFERALMEAQQAGAGGIIDEVFNPQDTEGLNIASLSDSDQETKEVIIRREICEFAQHSPQIVAQLLKNWMREGEDEAANGGKKSNAASSADGGTDNE